MLQYIDKSALVAEIERRRSKNSKNKLNLAAAFEDNYLLSFLDNLEVKDVDLNLEIILWANAIPGIRLDDVKRLAKHFFELGLKTQYSSINIPNIDDLFEEDGIDPNSKEAKIFKESYYTALERYKEKKG